MDNLNASFTIEVDGKPIAKVGPDAEDRAQATTGSDAAVFTLKDGRLRSGEWVLARPLRENRSFAPKPVCWFKIPADSGELRVHPVTAHEDGESYDIKFASMNNFMILCEASLTCSQMQV